MRAWIAYVAATGGVLTLVSAVVSRVLPGVPARSIQLAAAVAFGVQLVAFAALVVARSNARRFVVSWVSGTVLRVGALVGVGVVASARSDVSAQPALVALVTFVLALVLIEPVFLRISE